MAFWDLLFHLSLMFLASAAAAAEEAEASIARPGCPHECGNVGIPYPFGIKDGCFRDDQDGFQLFCNDTYDPPKPFLDDYYFLGISLEGEAIVTAYVASDCYNQSGYEGGYTSSMEFSESGSFTFSNTRNKFTAIGCDTLGYITGNTSERNFTTGCNSICWDKESVETESCSGIGCCQTSINSGAKWFQIELESFYNHSDILNFNPCSYAFLIKDDQFEFNVSDLTATGRYSGYSDKPGFDKRVPVVVDWAIGNQTCESALKNSTSYACKSKNSNCYNSTNGPGYRCKCSQGFQGNPYLEQGCKDIDECKTGNHTCRVRKCVNNEGGYSCKPNVQLIVIFLGIGSGLSFVLMACAFMYLGFQKRKLLILREKFFRKNGGLLLQQQISSNRVVATTKIFSEAELKRATNNYDEAQIIGQGGNGTVYKGILPGHTIVAIKKSKIVDQTQIEDFINEVIILSQINHRNVVKLLGCCLETPVPLLVYEYISNGNLFQYIHNEAHPSSLSLANRLRIASETAGALDYLHFAASTPIFHRDVKSANILLDDNLTAKVSDFGASRLIPLDQTQLSTLVQGTLGYLDPEYFQTGQLTEKSDVYSFGVVLVELLTGERPICANRSQTERNLSNYFLLSMEDNRLFQVLENRVVDEGDVEQLVAVAELSKRCLKIKGEERPTMKEVAMELEGLKRSVEHPWVETNHEETQSLLGDLSVEACSGNGNATGQDSLTLNNHNINALEIGR